MIATVRSWVRGRWPQLRLRTILFATLFLVAALPGVGAVFLRVYENALVRQTEAELVAQGTALAAAAAALWPAGPDTTGAPIRPPVRSVAAVDTGIDLSTTPILPERPPPRPTAGIDPDAAHAAVKIEPIIAATRRDMLASILLLDSRGRIVIGDTGMGSEAALPEVAAALAGRPATVLRRNGDYRAVYRFEWLSRAAAIRVHYARPVIVGGRVVGVLLLSRSARALFKGIYEDRGKILLAIAAIFLLLVALSGLISRGVTRPIRRLGVATRAVAAGRGAVPDAPTTAAIEIQGLYADFRAMAAVIDRRSRYLRDFAYGVSHEFKTPLAGIRGALELIQDHPDMALADRNRFLANAQGDADRLTLLVTRLLDLARADMEISGDVAIDPNPIVAATLDAWRGDRLAIEHGAGAGLPAVCVPAATIETGLATLLDNSRQAGATWVRIDGGVLDTMVELRVSDNGPGIDPADELRLFETFFTTKRASGGTGLGLAIARSLLRASGGDLDFRSHPVAAFVVALPIAHPAGTR